MSGHVSTIAPDGDGFLVSCPQGCNLGTTARQPDVDGAERRAELHRISTEPLVKPDGWCWRGHPVRRHMDNCPQCNARLTWTCS